MLITLDEHYQAIQQMLEAKPHTVLASSYGVFAGILEDGQDVTQWGEKFSKQAHGVLDALQEVSRVQILVGMPKYQSCRPKVGSTHLRCQDCEDRYVESMARLYKHTLQWPKLRWRFSQNCTLRTWLFFYPDNTIRGLAGGRNLTDSELEDVTFELSPAQIKSIYSHYKRLWDGARDAHEDNIAAATEAWLQGTMWP
jgi:hypothetical protein